MKSQKDRKGLLRLVLYDKKKDRFRYIQAANTSIAAWIRRGLHSMATI